MAKWEIVTDIPEAGMYKKWGEYATRKEAREAREKQRKIPGWHTKIRKK